MNKSIMRPRANSSTSRGTGERARGSTLIEVMIAMVIMLLVMVGILQMFSLSLLNNMGSAARTQMTFKCQQVAEQLRLIYFLSGQSGDLVTTGGNLATAANVPTLAGLLSNTNVVKDLPYLDTDPGYPYWGPDGVGIIEGPNMPYKISFEIHDNPTYDATTNPNPANAQFCSIVVTAVASQTAPPVGATRFFGAGIANKRVEYVTAVKK